MSQRVTKILKTRGVGEKIIAFKKELSQKAFESIKQSCKSIRKSVVNKHINLREANVYDSLMDYSHNTDPKYAGLPDRSVSNNDFPNADLILNFESGESLAISHKESIKIINNFKKIVEPIIKQQLINKMNSSLSGFSSAIEYLEKAK